MANDELFANYFHPDDNQKRLLEEFRRVRKSFGAEHRMMYQRSLARTRKYTHTVYPK